MTMQDFCVPKNTPQAIITQILDEGKRPNGQPKQKKM